MRYCIGKTTLSPRGTELLQCWLAYAHPGTHDFVSWNDLPLGAQHRGWQAAMGTIGDPRSTRYRIRCDCLWESSWMRTQQRAEAAHAKHVQDVLKKAVISC